MSQTFARILHSDIPQLWWAWGETQQVVTAPGMATTQMIVSSWAVYRWPQLRRPVQTFRHTWTSSCHAWLLPEKSYVDSADVSDTDTVFDSNVENFLCTVEEKQPDFGTFLREFERKQVFSLWLHPVMPILRYHQRHYLNQWDGLSQRKMRHWQLLMFRAWMFSPLTEPFFWHS